jgi:hypothetical protein
MARVNGRNATVTAPEDEVVGLVSALIRFDTSNTGELETTNGEAECAQWVAGVEMVRSTNHISGRSARIRYSGSSQRQAECAPMITSSLTTT